VATFWTSCHPPLGHLSWPSSCSLPHPSTSFLSLTQLDQNQVHSIPSEQRRCWYAAGPQPEKVQGHSQSLKVRAITHPPEDSQNPKGGLQGRESCPAVFAHWGANCSPDTELLLLGRRINPGHWKRGQMHCWGEKGPSILQGKAAMAGRAQSLGRELRSQLVQTWASAFLVYFTRQIQHLPPAPLSQLASVPQEFLEDTRQIFP
jgi:hypothetical protein